MNQADRKEFDLIQGTIDTIKKSIDDMKHDMFKKSRKDRRRSIVPKRKPIQSTRRIMKKPNRIPNSDRTLRSGECYRIGFVGLVIDKVWKLFQ